MISAVIASEMAKVSLLRDFVPAYRKIPTLVLFFVTCYFEIVSLPQGSKIYEAGELKSKLGMVIEGKLLAKFQESSMEFSIIQVSLFVTLSLWKPRFLHSQGTFSVSKQFKTTTQSIINYS